MSSKIVSRSFSKEGLDNWDKIFGKNKELKKKIKKAIENQRVNPMIPVQKVEPIINTCPKGICDGSGEIWDSLSGPNIFKIDCSCKDSFPENAQFLNNWKTNNEK